MPMPWMTKRIKLVVIQMLCSNLQFWSDPIAPVCLWGTLNSVTNYTGCSEVEWWYIKDSEYSPQTDRHIRIGSHNISLYHHHLCYSICLTVGNSLNLYWMFNQPLNTKGIKKGYVLMPKRFWKLEGRQIWVGCHDIPVYNIFLPV